MGAQLTAPVRHSPLLAPARRSLAGGRLIISPDADRRQLEHCGPLIWRRVRLPGRGYRDCLDAYGELEPAVDALGDGMRSFARFAGIIACFMGSAASAAPAPGLAATPDAVETALAQHNLSAAGTALNNLVEARLPAKDSGKPDPVLDRLYADVLSANGELTPAGAILRRVVSDPRTPDPDHYQLLLAGYAVNTGAWAEAQLQYRQIAADPKAQRDESLAATLGLARLELAADPASALATLSTINPTAVPPDTAWEVDLLRARAGTMAAPDKASDARAALDRAWAEAPNASVADSAVATVAGDRALTAGRAGDRKTLIAMLAVDRSYRSANGGQSSIISDLPLCGTGGITPEDVVMIDVAHQAPAGRPPASLVWASRPGIAASFLLAAERSGSPTATDGQVASFALRCRTAPSTDYVVRNSIEEDIAGWMTVHGAYPDADAFDTDVSALAGKLARRQAQYGANSVMLLPLLFRTMLPGAINYGDPEGRKQASGVADHILTILDQNKAPESLTLMWRLTSIGMAVMAQTKTAAQGQAEMQGILGKAASDPALSLDTLYMLTMGTVRMPTMPSEFKIAMLSATLDLLQRKAPAGDQRTSAVALRLYQLHNTTGDEQGAKAAIAHIEVPQTACDLSDPLPHYVSSNITSDDYPGDLVFMSMPGLSYFEFDLDAAGNAQNGRLLLEDPPYAFNQIALARIPTVHYDPARFGGKVAACRGATQSIRWQLP